MVKKTGAPDEVIKYIEPRDNIHHLVRFTQDLQSGKRIPETETLTYSFIMLVLRCSATRWPDSYLYVHRSIRFCVILHTIINLNQFYFFPEVSIQNERERSLKRSINTVHITQDISLIYKPKKSMKFKDDEITALRSGMRTALQLNLKKFTEEPNITDDQVNTLSTAREIHSNLCLRNPKISPRHLDKSSNVFYTVIYMTISIAIFLEYTCAEFYEDQYDYYSIAFLVLSLNALIVNYLILKTYLAKNFECIEYHSAEKINSSIKKAFDFAPFSNKFLYVNDVNRDSVFKILNIQLIKKINLVVEQYLCKKLQENGITVIATENNALFVSARMILNEQQIEEIQFTLNQAHYVQKIIHLAELLVKDYVLSGSFSRLELSGNADLLTIEFSLKDQDPEKREALLSILQDKILASIVTEDTRDNNNCRLSIPIALNKRIHWKNIFTDVDQLFHPERYISSDNDAAPAPVKLPKQFIEEIQEYEQQRNHKVKAKQKRNWFPNLGRLFAPAEPVDAPAPATFDYNGSTITFDQKSHPDQFQVIHNHNATRYAYFPEGVAINREHAETFRRAFKDKGFSSRHKSGIVHDTDGDIYKIKIANQRARIWENPDEREIASDGTIVIILNHYDPNAHNNKTKHGPGGRR